jgi:hypothetical protein
MTQPLLDAATLASLMDITASSRVGAITDGSHTCTIITPAPVQSGGAPTRGTETRTDVPCLFWNVTGDEASADMLAQRGRYRIDVAIETAIDHNSSVEYQGAVYRVLWAPPPYEAGRIVGLTEA